jgi:hypothetical protein
LGALLLWVAGASWTQEGDYQRYDLVRETSEIIVESSVRTWVGAAADGGAVYFVRGDARGEYTFLTNHTVSVQAPYTFGWHNGLESRNPALYSFGDMQVSYEYLKQLGHVNVFFGPQLTIPLYDADEYAAREGVYAGGDGRYKAGFSVSVTGIRDPVVWSTGLSYDVGLPKRERFYTSVAPGNIQVSGGFSDLLNERFGFSFALVQTVNLPPVKDGV